MNALGTLFKDFKRENHFIKKLNIMISTSLTTHIFIIFISISVRPLKKNLLEYTSLSKKIMFS